jgi:site-specific recombinase XerD
MGDSEVETLKRELEKLKRQLEDKMSRPKSDIEAGMSVFRVGFGGESDINNENRPEHGNQNRHGDPRRFSNEQNENRRRDSPRRISRGWDGLVSDWAEEFESFSTRKNKRVFGKQFAGFCNAEGIEPAELQAKHLVVYKKHLQDDSSKAVNTIHTMICSGVKPFCTFLYQEGVTRTNVGVRLKAPPYVQSQKDAMTEADIRALFGVANRRQTIVLAFGFYLAMRVEALVSLKRNNITEIDHENRSFVVTWKAKGDRVVSKTFRDFEVMPVGWVKKMEAWEPEAFLLPGRKIRSHVTSRTAERWMTKMGTECNIMVDLEGRSTITPHDLRHAGGTIVAKKTNGNAYQIKAHLHHKNISTSQHYVHYTAEETREALPRFGGHRNF